VVRLLDSWWYLAMKALSYRGYRFPPVIIRHAVWLHLHFTLRSRDVQDLLAERGIFVSRETIRRWVIDSGPIYARRLGLGAPHRLDNGISTRSSSQLPVGRCICGAPLMMKARPSTFSFKPGATRMQHCA
jgi:hypothetical protein